MAFCDCSPLASRHLVCAAGALLAASLAVACRSTPGTPAAPSANAWAVVDGREITRDDVEKAFRRTRDMAQTLSDEEALAAKLSLLEELIVQDILIAKASALKIQVPDSEVDSAFNERKKNMTEAAFQQELTGRQLTSADMREGLRREMLARKVIEQEVTSKVAVTDQEIIDFFNANRAQFNVAEESYRVAQIVVTPMRDQQRANRTGDDAATPEAAAAKIKMLAERLKAGTSFRELAMDYSEDPESAPRGGDMGFIPVSQLKQAPPALRNAVLGKEAGTVNVVTASGAHTIVAVVARETPGQRDLSNPAVKETISGNLRGRKEELLRAAYLTTARTEAKVDNILARRIVEGQGKMPSLMPSKPGTN